jgi:hypothetical protein
MPSERARPVEEMQFLFISVKLQVLFGRYLSDRVHFQQEHYAAFWGGIVFKNIVG